MAKGETKFLDDLHDRYDIVRKWKHGAMSTGVLALDQATTKGGFPRGLLVDLYGDEGLGKTTLILTMMAERIRCGERCIFIDAEHRLQNDLVTQIIPGAYVNDDEQIRQKDDLFRVYQPLMGEEVFSIIEQLVREPSVRMIALDSVATLTFKEEVETDKYTTPIGILARRVGLFSKRILGPVYEFGPLVVFINQMRMAQSSYGPMFKSSTGGKAIRFVSSLRVHIRAEQLIKEGETIVGQRVKLQIEKNSFGAPQRETSISIMYGKGIDRVRDLVDTALEAGVATQSGGWYKLTWKGQELAGHGEADFVEKVAPYLDELRAHVQQTIAERAEKLRQETEAKARELAEADTKPKGKAKTVAPVEPKQP
jgi:recombination protein RecA